MRLYQLLIWFLIVELAINQFSPIGIAQEPLKPALMANVEAPNLIFNEANDSITVQYWQFTLKVYKSINLIEWYAQNGSLFLQDSHILQNSVASAWNNLSVPFGLEWNFINATAMQIKKTYQTGSRLGMNVTFLVSSCKPVKFNAALNLPAAYVLRYSWALSFKNQANFTLAAPRKLTIGNNISSLFWMSLDWSDVINKKGNILRALISRANNNINAQLYFNIGALAANTPYELEPDYIGDSTNAFALGFPFSRKYWFCNTKMFLWYSNGTHLGWRYNTTLTAWSSFNYVRACQNGEHFGVVMNSSYVAYAFCNTSSSVKPTYWRMGSVASGGSITWLGTGEYLVYNYSTFVAVGSWPVPILSGNNGWPYVAFTYVNTTARTALAKSAYSNGTWSSSWIRELSSSTWSGRYIGGAAKGTTANLRLYWYNSSVFHTLLYNATSDTFQNRQEIDSAQTRMIGASSAMFWSCVSDDNYDCVAWLGRRTGLPANYSCFFDFKSSSRNFNTTDEAIQILNGTSSMPVLTLDSSANYVYAFYWHKPTAYHLYYRSRDLTINYMPATTYFNYWSGSSTDWFTDTPQSYARQQTIDKKQGSKIFYAYLNETSSPYHLKWANLSLAISLTMTVTLNQAAATTQLLNAYRILNQVFRHNVNVDSSLEPFRIILRTFNQETGLTQEFYITRILTRIFEQETVVYQDFWSSGPRIVILILAQAVTVIQAFTAILPGVPGFQVWWIVAGLFILMLIGSLFFLAMYREKGL